MFPVKGVYFGQLVMWQDIFINIGTALGILAFWAAAFWSVKKDARLRLFAAMAIAMLPAMLGGKLLRNIMEGALFEPGSHFIGTVLCWTIIFPLAYLLIFKTFKGIADGQNCAVFFFLVQHIFNRIGCYATGCCFGTAYGGPLAAYFPTGSPAYQVYGETSVFPTQMFEVWMSAILLMLCIGLFIFKRRVFPVFLSGFALMIFVSELFIYNEGDNMFFTITYPQLAAGIMLAIGCFIAVYNLQSIRKGPQNGNP